MGVSLVFPQVANEHINRDAPNMLKNLPIIPSRTSQNLSLLFFKIPPIIPKLFRSESKKVIAIAN